MMRHDDKGGGHMTTAHTSLASEDGYTYYLEKPLDVLSSTVRDWWHSTTEEHLQDSLTRTSRRARTFDSSTSGNFFLDRYNDILHSLNQHDHHHQNMEGDHEVMSLRSKYKKKLLLNLQSILVQMKEMWYVFLDSPIAPEVGRLLVMILVATFAYKMGQRKATPRQRRDGDDNSNEYDDDNDDDETGSNSRKSVDSEKDRSKKHKKRKRLVKLNLKRHGGKGKAHGSTTSTDDGGSIDTGDDGSSSLETGISSLRSGGVSREVSKNRHGRKGGGVDGDANGNRAASSDVEVSRWRRMLTGSRHGTRKGEKEPIVGQEISVSQSQLKGATSQHVQELDIVIERDSGDDDEDDNINEQHSGVVGASKKVPLNDEASSMEEQQSPVPVQLFPEKTAETIDEFNVRVKKGGANAYSPADDTSEKDDEDTTEVPLEPKRLLGPDVCSIKFFVSTPPREDILGLFAPMKYRSIHRLLELNVYDLTITLHIPKVDQDEEDTPSSSAALDSSASKTAEDEKTKKDTAKGSKNDSKAQQEQEDEKIREEKFIRGPRIPLSCVKNAHALMPLTSGVIKMSFAVPKIFVRDTPVENTPDVHAKKAQVETTITSSEKGIPLDPAYDVLELENNFRELKRRTYIAQKSGFDVEPTVLPNDQNGGIAVHGCTPSPSPHLSLEKRKRGTISEEEADMHEDTLEFTFENAREAALFQHLMMNLNTIGHPLRNLYRSLETLRIFRILNGSRGEAYQLGSDSKNENNKDKATSESPRGDEASATGAGPQKDRLLWRELEEAMSDSRSKTALLRDPMLLFLRKKGFDPTELFKHTVLEGEGDGWNPSLWGVALDDAYRCLSTIPVLKKRLQTFYDAHYPSWRTMADFDSGLEMINAGYYFDQSTSVNNIRLRQQRSMTLHNNKEKTQEISVIAAVAEAEAKREKQIKKDKNSNKKETDEKEESSDSSQYRNFRNVMGIGDLLYILLGVLPLDVVPIPCPSANKSGVGYHFSNCKDELVIRRRVARASHLVEQYVKAMKVVEIGWDASPIDAPSNLNGAMPSTPVSQVVWQSTRNLGGGGDTMEVTMRKTRQHHGPVPLIKRLAFDDNLANISHDAVALNEYYEATVGRDIMRCDAVKKNMVPVQGFAMVGVNVFRTSTTGALSGGPDGHQSREIGNAANSRTIYPTDDPVLAIPSLRDLIESNPEVDFFVSSFFPDRVKVCVVMVFVRCLPSQTDEVFEEALQNFCSSKNGQPLSKIDVHIQLGPLPTMSPYKFSLLKGAVGIHNWNQRRKGGLEIPQLKDRGTDRFPLPPVNLEDYTEVCRFGIGSSSSSQTPLQRNKGLLSNYRSFTSRINPRMFYNPIYRLLYSQIDERITNTVFDMSICLRQEAADTTEGSQETNPSSMSRVLGTVRLCHISTEDIALPCPATSSVTASETTAVIGNFPDRRRANSSGPILNGNSAMNRSSTSSGIISACSHLDNSHGAQNEQGMDSSTAGNSFLDPERGGSLDCHCRSSDQNGQISISKTAKASSKVAAAGNNLDPIQELSNGGGDGDDEEEQDSNASNELHVPPELRKKNSLGDSTLSSVQHQRDDSFVTARNNFFDGILSSTTNGREAEQRLLSDSLGSISFTSKHSTASSDANSGVLENHTANGDNRNTTSSNSVVIDESKAKVNTAFESSPAFRAMKERKRKEDGAKNKFTASLPISSSNEFTANDKGHRRVQSVDATKAIAAVNGSFTPPRKESNLQEGQRPSHRTMRRRSRVLSKRRIYDEKEDSTPMRSNTSSSSHNLGAMDMNLIHIERAPSEMRPLFASQREDYVSPPPTDSPGTLLTQPTSSMTAFSGSMEGDSYIKSTSQIMESSARSAELNQSDILDAEFQAARSTSWRNSQVIDTSTPRHEEIGKSALVDAESHAAKIPPWPNQMLMDPLMGYHASLSDLTDQEHKAAQRSSWRPLTSKAMDTLPLTSAALGAIQTEVDLTSSGRNLFSGKKMSDMGRQLRAMLEILSGINVPMRRDNPIVRHILPHLSVNKDISCNNMDDDNFSSTDPLVDKRTLDVSVLYRVRSYDLARYLISNQWNLKMATVRYIESAAWRGLTFPIDPRTCDVELESAQFFHQGIDFDGRPVIYFRRLCRGPWREDVDASISAILFRLEQAVVSWSTLNPKIQFTMVFLDRKAFALGSERRMERKFRPLSLNRNSLGSSTSDGAGSRASSRKKFFQDGTESEVSSVTSAGMSRDGAYDRNPPLWLGSNPRLDSSETWNSHTNRDMEARLAKILCRHYPMIFSQILVIDPHEKPQSFIRCLLKEDSNMSSVVKYVKGFHELKNYIDEDQLLSFAGGNAITKISHFTAG